MAANSYYDVNMPMVHEQQQHLLAHSKSPNGHQLDQLSPLKPLHFAAQTEYHYAHSKLENFESLQQAEQEDAVRLYTPLTTATTNNGSISKRASAASASYPVSSVS